MSALERRLRRLAVIVPIFAVAAATFGMLPDGVDLLHHSFKHGTNSFVGTARAGGWSLVGWALLQVVAGSYVRAQPTRATGVQWIVLAIVIDIAGAIAWLFESFTLEPVVLEWPGHATAACVAAASALVFVALPLVLLASSRSAASPVPDARVVS